MLPRFPAGTDSDFAPVTDIRVDVVGPYAARFADSAGLKAAIGNQGFDGSLAYSKRLGSLVKSVEANFKGRLSERLHVSGRELHENAFLADTPRSWVMG
jgi:hypothetical protein